VPVILGHPVGKMQFVLNEAALMTF